MSKTRMLQAIQAIESNAQRFQPSGGAEAIFSETKVLRVLLESDLDTAPAAVAMTNPASQSSVEIEQLAKGGPKLKVKVYDANPYVAMTTAQALYDGAVRRYAEGAKVEEGNV